MEKVITIDDELVSKWIDAKLSPVDIQKQLEQQGFSEETIAMYVREYKKRRYAGRRFNGFICAAIGALLGFLSCLLSIFNPIPELFNIILFGLTSIAILIIFFGLYLLFE